MIPQPKFSDLDHQTWNQLFTKQSTLRAQQIIPEFQQGLHLLNITAEEIPDIRKINSTLLKLTGWQGVYVPGLVEAADFFKMLADRKFPIGAFIRDPRNLSYTPAPDVFHDLYGHIPFYTIPEYAKFCERFGSCALKYCKSDKIVAEFQRLFWFTIEFGLLQTDQGPRIFGAGIASSFAECAYALSSGPEVEVFNLEKIRHQDFRIDEMQKKLFKLESSQQLYVCLDDFEKPYLRKFK